MHSEQPASLFQVKQRVVLVADLQSESDFQSGPDNVEAYAMVTTTVEDCYYQEALGWIYRLMAMGGLYPEAQLKEAPAGDTSTGANVYKPTVLTREGLYAILANEPHQPGDYVKMVDMQAVDEKGNELDIYGMITGKHVDCGEVDYSIAMMNTKGEFVENSMSIFQSDEFEPVDEFEIAKARHRHRPRPALKLVAS